MDRITALRTIEEALTAYENGELALPELEGEVQGILRTYATEFDEETTAYRANGDPAVDGLTVVAASRSAAREQMEELLPEPADFEIETIE